LKGNPGKKRKGAGEKKCKGELKTPIMKTHNLNIRQNRGGE